MVIEFTKAVALLLALCLVQGFIARRWSSGELVGRILSGVLFGGICVIGMETPIEAAPGVIFDARSVVLSMAGLFGGPIVGGIAAVIAGGYRVWLGGGGAPVGVSVVISCVLLGLVYRHAYQRGWLRIGVWQLLAFGLLVHLVEILLFTFLPDTVVGTVMDNIALPLVVTFTPATALLGSLLHAIELQIQTGKSLTESEARFRDVAEVSGDWIWETDSKLRFTFLSPRFFQLFPFEVDDVIGKTRDEFAHVGPKDETWHTHIEVLTKRLPFRDFYYTLVAPDGGIGHFRISGKPVYAPDGSFQGYRGTGSDVTAEAETKASLLVAKEHAELANRAKSEFLANMSHELRTPLNSILGYSEAIKDEVFGPHNNPRYSEYAAAIQASGKHLLGLITYILDISKIEAGEATVEDSKVDLSKAINDTISMARLRIEAKRIDVRFFGAEKCSFLRADERQFKQIMLNLLSNALKFTSPGGRVSVNTRLDESGGQEISVTDTGIGIAAEEIPKVMKPFGQVADSHIRNHDGTGLGLSICNSLMELHGGCLNIESEIGQGTKVTLHFPPERTIHVE